MSKHNDDCAGRNGVHTPGPWQVRSGIDGSPKMDSRDGYTVERADPTAGKPFVVSTWSLPNARLIAAAPELLEALKVALAIIEGFEPENGGIATDDELAGIRAAIARATGVAS